MGTGDAELSENRALQEIAKSRAWIEREREMMNSHIRDAHRQGVSLRKIAEAAGFSHEKVRGLISQDQT